MGVEDFSPDAESSSEAGPGAPESIREADPAKVSKTLRNIRKTRGDEKKAQRGDDALAHILAALLRDPAYAFLIDAIVPLAARNVPSHFIVGCVSLVYAPANTAVRREYYRPARDPEPAIPAYEPSTEPVAFDENALPEAVRDRINRWIEDMSAVITYEPSNIVTEKFLGLLAVPKYRDVIEGFVAGVFEHFLATLSVIVSEHRSESYAEFITDTLEKRLKGVYDPLFFERDDDSSAKPQ
jgi:hypothetical protein